MVSLYIQADDFKFYKNPIISGSQNWYCKLDDASNKMVLIVKSNIKNYKNLLGSWGKIIDESKVVDTSCFPPKWDKFHTSSLYKTEICHLIPNKLILGNVGNEKVCISEMFLNTDLIGENNIVCFSKQYSKEEIQELWKGKKDSLLEDCPLKEIRRIIRSQLKINNPDEISFDAQALRLIKPKEKSKEKLC